MVLIVFRSRLRSDADIQEFGRLGERMYMLAAGMPGFISYKDFSSADGESVSLVEFESMETLEKWRTHPEHLAAQKRGRDEFFAEYRTQIAIPSREHSFGMDRSGGAS